MSALSFDFKTFFEAAFCINLDRRHDRWEKFQSQVPAEWPFCSIERVSAVDGRLVPQPEWWKQGGGAWGCYRSHLRIIEHALNHGLQSILLLEDDAAFCDDFNHKAQQFLEALPPEWGMIYLGGQHLFVNHCPPRKVNEFVYSPFNVNRTHAYALRGQAIADVYRHLCRIDWHERNHIDHHLGRFHQKRQTPVYCPAEWLVGQADGKSNISGRTVPLRFWPHAEEIARIKPENELFVAVVGLHSSGSSCLAGVLHHMGLHLGNQLVGYYGNDPANNKCGFEAIGLQKLCEEAVPFPSQKFQVKRAKVRSGLKTWINQKRREAAARGTIAAGKYPQLCRMGQELVSICGEQLRVVVSERPIEESIESLRRRCPDVSHDKIRRHQLWLEQGKQRLLSRLKSSQILSVSYSEMVRHPLNEVERIAGFLNLTPTESQLQSIQAWVNPDKQHVKECTLAHLKQADKVTAIPRGTSSDGIVNTGVGGGQYLIAEFHLENGEIRMKRLTNRFPTDEFDTVVSLLEKDLASEIYAGNA